MKVTVEHSSGDFTFFTDKPFPFSDVEALTILVDRVHLDLRDVSGKE